MINKFEKIYKSQEARERSEGKYLLLLCKYLNKATYRSIIFQYHKLTLNYSFDSAKFIIQLRCFSISRTINIH